MSVEKVTPSKSPVDSFRMVSPTPKTTTTLPKIIQESRSVSNFERKSEANVSPSLWQRFKLKARQVSRSTAAFAKQHPDALKSAVVATAVAVVFGVVQASQKSMPADSSGVSNLQSPEPPTKPSNACEEQKRATHPLLQKISSFCSAKNKFDISALTTDKLWDIAKRNPKAIIATGLFVGAILARKIFSLGSPSYVAPHYKAPAFTKDTVDSSPNREPHGKPLRASIADLLTKRKLSLKNVSLERSALELLLAERPSLSSRVLPGPPPYKKFINPLASIPESPTSGLSFVPSFKGQGVPLDKSGGLSADNVLLRVDPAIDSVNLDLTDFPHNDEVSSPIQSPVAQPSDSSLESVGNPSPFTQGWQWGVDTNTLSIGERSRQFTPHQMKLWQGMKKT